MMLKRTLTYFAIVGVVLLTASCAAGPDNPGREYAPQMYHSTPYEPLSQIMDKSAGSWLDSNEKDGQGEFYNSNPYNPHTMTMRRPVEGTVRRDQPMPYSIPKDSLALAARTLVSPFALDSLGNGDKTVLKEGKALYNSYCQHCHGKKGDGKGKVADKYPGVANLKGSAYANVSEGHIFHVITHGKGMMGAHASQVSQEDRWKIARYVKELQK